MIRAFILSLILLITIPTAANPKVHHKLSVAGAAKQATNIIVATEDPFIDGQLTILESLKGDLTPGDSLYIPELADLNSEESREVKCLSLDLGCRDDGPRLHVTCSKMILFLRKNDNTKSDSADPNSDFSDSWTGVNDLNVAQSLIWIEGNRTYAIYDAGRNEKGTLADYEMPVELIRILIEDAVHDESNASGKGI